MFYSHLMLSRKGPLATIWLAAYCYHKLKRHQIATTDIAYSVDKIIPEVEVSYRLVAHLLLGVVRIFSKKVDILYRDCNEALSRVQRSLVETLRREPLRNHAAAPSPSAAVAAAAVVVAIRETRHVKRTKPAALPPPAHASPTDTSAEQEEDEQEEEAEAAAPKRAKTTRLLQDPTTSGPPKLLSPPEAPMIAPYREGTITIPETLELASFDLELPDHRDDDNNHHLIQLQTGDQEAKTESFLIQNNRTADQPDSSFDDACFTPVADSVVQDVDVDFEINETTATTTYGEGTSGKSADEDLSFVPLPVTAFPTARKSLSVDIHADDDFQPPHQHYDSTQIPPQPTLDKSKPSKSTSIPGQPTSPQFTVATPAKLEGYHFLSKRKRHQLVFDHKDIVLSNETLRKGLDDSTDLVKKREKAPHTYLDAWKTQKFSDLAIAFVEPLISYNYIQIKDTQVRRSIRTSSLKTTALNSKLASSTASPSNNVRRAKRKSAHTLAVEKKTTKTKPAPASAVERETATHVLPQVTSGTPLENGGETDIDSPLENGGETNGDATTLENGESPIHLQLDLVAGASFAETTVDLGTNDYAFPGTSVDKTKVGEPSSGTPDEIATDENLGIDSGEPAASTSFEAARPPQLSQVLLSDVETETENDNGGQPSNQSGLSARTRLIARNLHRAFKNKICQEQGGAVSLLRILDGKKRGTGARFFYETLVLTTRGCMEVKQDSPYGDIFILASSERTLRPIAVPMS